VVAEAIFKCVGVSITEGQIITALRGWCAWRRCPPSTGE